MLPALLGVGLGLSAIGTLTNIGASKKLAAESKKQAQLEQQVERQRMAQMEIDARRKQMEVLRNQQRARASALAVATSQGASLGTGLAGAYGQIAGQTGTNLLGITQNLDIGRNIFDVNAKISQSKMRLADAQSQAAIGQGLTSLGGSVLNTMEPINRLGRNTFGTGFNNFGFTGLFGR